MANSESFELVVAGGIFEDRLQTEHLKLARVGGAFYASSAAARLGIKTAAFCGIAVSNTELATAQLDQSGVNWESCIVNTEPGCIYDILGADEFDEPHVANFGRRPFEVDLPMPKDVPRGIWTLLYPINGAWAFEVAQKASGHGSKIAIDCQHDVPSKQDLWNLLRYAAILFCSERAFLDLVEAVDFNLGIAELRKRFSGVICIKRGLLGATLVIGETEYQIKAYDVQYQITVGAGDIFDAAFLASTIQGRYYDEAAVAASRVAALFTCDSREDAPCRTELSPTKDPGAEIGLSPADYERYRIYLAGHFHGQLMQAALSRLKRALQRAHFQVVLPHEDIGITHIDGITPTEAFAKDLEAIDSSDLVVAALDYASRGGTGFELGYAYHANKVIIGTHSEQVNRPSNMFINGCVEIVEDYRSIVAATLRALPFL